MVYRLHRAYRAARAKHPQTVVVDHAPEWKLQAAIAAEFERLGVCFAAGLEGVRLTARQRVLAKATGMQAGEPDLRVYLPGGRLVLIELKSATGSLRPEQKERHARLRALGFEVHVLKAKTEAEAVAGALKLIGLA